ncbi:MAG: amino acid ABC transporter permease [Acidimicrobiia bacterium]
MRERFEQWSASIPFKVKLGMVWAVIALIVVVLFSLADFDVEWMIDHLWFITQGLPWTVVICGLAILLAVTLALFGALGRLSNSAIAQGVSSFYTSFFRGTPLIVQMFLIFLALPQLAPANLPGLRDSLTLTALQAGIIALGLNYGAYMTEIFRAGIQSVGHGQVEAAEALGMSYRQRMRRIVLPQAIRMIIPPTGNEFIAMLKDSALISLLGSVVAQMEIFRRAQLVGRADFRPLEAFVLAAALYWILTTVFQFFQTRLERRLSVGYVRTTIRVTTQPGIEMVESEPA